jgi:hypothetical protein
MLEISRPNNKQAVACFETNYLIVKGHTATYILAFNNEVTRALRLKSNKN